jgi:hypothetical protein
MAATRDDLLSKWTCVQLWPLQCSVAAQDESSPARFQGEQALLLAMPRKRKCAWLCRLTSNPAPTTPFARGAFVLLLLERAPGLTWQTCESRPGVERRDTATCAASLGTDRSIGLAACPLHERATVRRHEVKNLELLPHLQQLTSRDDGKWATVTSSLLSACCFRHWTPTTSVRFHCCHKRITDSLNLQVPTMLPTHGPLPSHQNPSR